MSLRTSNNSLGLLSASLSIGSTTVALVDASSFPSDATPSDPVVATLEDALVTYREVVHVTGKSGNNLTIVRAREGTSPQSFAAGDTCETRVTAGITDELQTQIDGKSASSHLHTGVYEPANSNIQTHIADTVMNPHGVTAAQAGADTAGSAAAVQSNLDTHEADVANPHAVTAAQAGAEPVNANIQAHIADVTTNPHAVTASQAGAEPDLGNPGTDGHVLSSTIAGARSWVAQSAGGGEANLGANVGTGTGLIFRDKTSVTLNMKSLIAGTGVTITNNANDIQIDATGAGGGEVNTASNDGTGGVGIVLAKNGVDLPFKSIFADSSKITVVDGGANDRVELDVAEANVVHDNLSGAGTNTHAQIDTHLANTSNPHTVTTTQIGALPAAGGAITGGFTTAIHDVGAVSGTVVPDFSLSQLQTWQPSGNVTVNQPTADGGMEVYVDPSVNGTISAGTGMAIIGSGAFVSGSNYILNIRRFGSGAGVMNLVEIA